MSDPQLDRIENLLVDQGQKLSAMDAYQKTHYEKLNDHEIRLRAVEIQGSKNSWFIGLFSSTVGAGLVMLFNYLFKGGN